MIIMLFIAAIIVSGILGSQERRHALELAIEFEKLGLAMPRQKPKLTMLQAVLNIAVGIVIAGMGGMFLFINLQFLAKVGRTIFQGGYMVEAWLSITALIAGGISLIVVGWIAVRKNVKYNRYMMM